ncbi:hypothetical protein [Entomobacter blattae]|uniref:Uncharacterized protein n=1 Tax=Entomobacter blattae TaxID=2762277 RepID=A0A7H1NQF1_9PROT|nr:hypothetical protein [Entomobacter blattae]QNT78011.1 hypothetical protein JGUZn3_07780 [Entomobacter blattae]
MHMVKHTDTRTKRGWLLGGLLGLGFLLAPVSSLYAQEKGISLDRQRVFDTSDTLKIMQKTIYTLQDLDFAINWIDFQQGKIYGESLRNWTIQVMIWVTTDKNGKTFVGFKAMYGDEFVEDPRPINSFFRALARNVVDDSI